MRYQTGEATCGPCAVANACKALRLKISEDEAIVWLNRVKRKDNPTAEGTDEVLLLRSITEGAPKKHALKARGLNVTDTAFAVGALRGLIAEGAAGILAVDMDSHWLAVVGVIGRDFVVVDGGDSSNELTVVYSPEELVARWENPGNPSSFFAVILWRVK